MEAIDCSHPADDKVQPGQRENLNKPPLSDEENMETMDDQLRCFHEKWKYDDKEAESNIQLTELQKQRKANFKTEIRDRCDRYRHLCKEKGVTGLPKEKNEICVELRVCPDPGPSIVDIPIDAKKYFEDLTALFSFEEYKIKKDPNRPNAKDRHKMIKKMDEKLKELCQNFDNLPKNSSAITGDKLKAACERTREKMKTKSGKKGCGSLKKAISQFDNQAKQNIDRKDCFNEAEKKIIRDYIKVRDRRDKYLIGPKKYRKAIVKKAKSVSNSIRTTSKSIDKYAKEKTWLSVGDKKIQKRRANTDTQQAVKMAAAERLGSSLFRNKGIEDKRALINKQITSKQLNDVRNQSINMAKSQLSAVNKTKSQADQNKIIKEKSASIEKKLKENLINKTEKMLTERNNKKIAAKSDEIIRSRRDYKDIKRKSQEQKIEKLLGPNSVKDYGRKTGWAPNSRRRRDADVKKQLKNALNNKSMINSIVKTRGIKKQTNAQIKSTANKQRYNKGLLTQSEIIDFSTCPNFLSHCSIPRPIC